MKYQLLEMFAAIGAILIGPLVLMTVWIPWYCRRCKVKGSHAHTLALPAYYLLCAVGLFSYVCAAAREIGQDVGKGFLTLGGDILFCLFTLGIVVSLIRDAIQKCKTYAEASSPAELEGFKKEEAIAQTNPLGARGWLSIVCAFVVTFFSTIPFAEICLGKGYESSYSFNAGWLGWFTGLWLIFLRVMTDGPRRFGVQVLIAISSILATWLAVSFWRPFGVVALWGIGLVAGGVFALVYLNIEAGVFVGEMSLLQRIGSLFRIPKREEFLERKARTKQQFSDACMMPVFAMAEWGDASAQYGLGSAYRHGSGRERDWPEAYAWLTLAAETGGLPAETYRGDLKREMSPEQIAAGQKRADDLRVQIAARLKSRGK